MKSKTSEPEIMKFPSSVRIGPYDFRVGHLTVDDMRREIGREPPMGWCDTLSCVILVRQDLSPRKTADTFLHEIIHGIADNTGLAQSLPRDQVEAIVNSLAVNLIGVMRDNPKLFPYLNALALSQSNAA